jgi:glucan phosphoethanolaminetransferase (alkaline phosphatase superfamily)
MRLLHLILGILLVVIFLLTGQYMDIYLHHMVGVPDGLRLLYRTRHIFILLDGLVNLGLAAYLVGRRETWQRTMQWAGSILIILASILLVAAFFYDSTRGDLRTPLTHWGVYAIALGTLAHLFSGIRSRSGA